MPVQAILCTFLCCVQRKKKNHSLGACCQISVSSLSEKTRKLFLWEIQHNSSQLPWKGCPCFLPFINTDPLFVPPQKKEFFENYISKDRTNLQACQRMEIGYKMTCHQIGGVTAKVNTALLLLFLPDPQIFHSRMWTAYCCRKIGHFRRLVAVNKARML